MLASPVQHRLSMKLALVFVVLAAGSGCMFYEEDDEDNGVTIPPDVCGDGVRTGSEVCDDGNLIDGDGCSSSCGRIESFQIHWRTSTLAGDLRTCPVGFDLAEVILQPMTGPDIVRAVDCSDGVAELEVTPHAYRSSVRFSNVASGEIYGQTLPEAAVSGQVLTMYTDAGFARVTWDLRRETAQATDCQTALVDYIVATFTQVSGGAPITAAFHCSLTTATTAITAPIAAGSYDLVLTARGHASASTPVTIAPRSALTDPGPIVITIPSGT